MSVDLKAYHESVTDIARRAANMKRTLVEPFRTDDGSFLSPANTAEAQKRNQILESAIAGTVYESVEQGNMIAAIHARALQGYEKVHGHLPADDLLASCDKAIENALLFTSGKGGPGFVLEAAEMSTTEGVLMRNRLVSLILPVWLQTITANMCTFIPGEFNQSEFYRIKRVAGSTFGDLKKGDIIEWTYNGVYSAMDKKSELGVGDGNTKEFTFDSKTTFGTVYPFKRKRCRVYVNRGLAAEDNGNSVIVGTFAQAGSSVVVSGEVDYALGKIKVVFSNAPVDGVELHIGYDVDIEADPTLIPRVDHIMQSHVLYPHESAINGHATIQALWALRREIGQDIDNLTMQALRNLLAADKDKKHLHDMWFACTNTVEWDRTVPTALNQMEHYRTIHLALLEVDTMLRKQNGVAGMSGLVVGTQACNLFRALKSDDVYTLDIAPNFQSSAQPHYVGRLFQQWDLYCDPLMDSDPTKGANACLCYAKGPDHGQTAYVVGDAIPALTFRHPVMGDLVQRATMWDLAYRDMQPFDGSKYLCKLMITGE